MGLAHLGSLGAARAVLLSIAVCLPTSASFIDTVNASVPLDGQLYRSQAPLYAGERPEGFDLNYLMHSARMELANRLSSNAEIFLQEDDTFQDLQARYTDYKRPEYIAAVKVAKEADVIETVGMLNQGTRSQADNAGQLRQTKRHSVCRAYGRSCVDYIPT